MSKRHWLQHTQIWPCHLFCMPKSLRNWSKALHIVIASALPGTAMFMPWVMQQHQAEGCMFGCKQLLLCIEGSSAEEWKLHSGPFGTPFLRIKKAMAVSQQQHTWLKLCRNMKRGLQITTCKQSHAKWAAGMPCRMQRRVTFPAQVSSPRALGLAGKHLRHASSQVQWHNSSKPPWITQKQKKSCIYNTVP